MLSKIGEFLAVKFLGRRVPLVVTWPITNRCNFSCLYCERWKRKTKELTTKQIFSIIDKLQKLGTVRISLSGGEPLVREDIGEIVDYIKEKGISVVLTTNGSLVSQRIEVVKNLDLLKISLEGEEKIHDKIRGKGSFQKVLLAVRALIGRKPRFVFNSVLTAYNLDQIDFLLSLAEKYKTGVRFSALNVAHAGEEKIRPLSPRREDYQKAIEKLVLAKKRGRPVLNSPTALSYLKNWPNPSPLSCFAGKAFAHLSAEGKLYPCVMMEGKVKGRDVLQLGFSRAFESLPKPECSGCWCAGTLEFNLLLSFKPSAVLNLRRLM